MKNKKLNQICLLLISVIVFSSCKKEEGSSYIQPDGGRYSEIFTGGQFHLGPVDWDQTEWINAFGPYPEKIRQIEGNYLAGLELSHNGKGEICDACVKIETDMGKELIVRVITTGYTTENSIDLSPEAFEILNSEEYPRSMQWYITKCPANGENIYYQFKTGSNQWWVAFWARNVSLPVEKVEVKSDNHSEWFTCRRESDGSYVDASGFGTGSFTIKVTAIDGSVIEDTFDSYQPGGLLKSAGQF